MYLSLKVGWYRYKYQEGRKMSKWEEKKGRKEKKKNLNLSHYE